KIGRLANREGFAQKPLQTTDGNGELIKKSGARAAVLGPEFAQFEELVAAAVRFESAHSPYYVFKRGTLVVRHFDGRKGLLRQSFHRDPPGPEKGQLYNLYSSASSAPTEIA